MNFKILKIPVYIDPSFWVFFLFIIGSGQGGYRTNLLFGVVVVFSILLHELGHALVALFYNAKPVVRLYAFGGETTFDKSVITNKQNFLIILGGPLIQFLFILTMYALLQFNLMHNYYLVYVVLITKYLNTMWLYFNLLPIIPLDGGWLLRYVLEKKFGRKGYAASIIIGLLTILIAIPFVYLRGYYIFLTMLVIFGLQYCKLWQER
ncbi:MAG: site-2 protease family protein [Amoebophilaceae bacterium]|nr:site-2 protease family protein [Amoebophilaceae bacterium]